MMADWIGSPGRIACCVQASPCLSTTVADYCAGTGHGRPVTLRRCCSASPHCQAILLSASSSSSCSSSCSAPSSCSPSSSPMSSSSPTSSSSLGYLSSLYLLLLLVLLATAVVPCCASCPNNCTCDEDVLVVNCESESVDVIPIALNPQLERLTIHNTKIHALDLTSVRFYIELQHVDLSNNLIDKIDDGVFDKQVKLQELHLGYNKISVLKQDMFKGLVQLKVLTLRHNSLKYLRERVFHHLKQLEDLDISENRIESIDNRAFEDLANLRVLHLHHNRLPSVPAPALDLVPQLAELSLGANVFTQLKEEDFQSLAALLTLNLSGTALAEGIPPLSFAGAKSLRTLHLEDCKLFEVPSEALERLESLEELHIGKNLFEEIPHDVFHSNKKLQSLYVSGCPNLMYIDRIAFKENLDLKVIEITENKQLTYIPDDTFRFLSSLTSLDLRDNNLQYISEKAASWKDIPRWDIQGNPLACNCSAAWLRTLLIKLNASETGERHTIKCATPANLKDVPLISTQLSDLSCGLDPSMQSLVIGAVVIGLVVIAALVVFLLYRHRDSCVRRILKGHKWGHRNPRVDEYQRTCIQDQPEYIMRHYKEVPVTEL